MEALYAVIMVAGRAAVANWSYAATSKALHQIDPALFVMWDVKLRPFAEGYSDFVLEMHRRGRRRVEEVV